QLLVAFLLGIDLNARDILAFVAAGECAALTEGDDEIGLFLREDFKQLSVEVVEVVHVDVDFRFAIGAKVGLGGVGSGICGPAAIQLSGRVVGVVDRREVLLASIDRAIAVQIGAEQQGRCYAFDEQQLFDRAERAVAGGVRRVERRVVIAFGALVALVIIW